MYLLMALFISGLAALWGVIILIRDGDWETLGLASLLALFLVGPFIAG